MLIYSEDKELACELASGVREVADSLSLKVSVCIPDSSGGGDVILAHGADRVIILKNWSTLHGCDAIASSLERVIKMVSPRYILIAGTKSGKEVGAYLAARTGSGCISEVKKVVVRNGKPLATRVVYGGRFTSEISCSSGVCIMIISPHAFEKRETHRGGSVEVIDVGDIPSRVKRISTTPRVKSESNLQDAQVVVCIGRGLKKKDDLPLIKGFADAVNGSLGCSRPLSQDLGWFPPGVWIGLSGIKIKPRLYFCIGVSGQIQHVAGITDSKIIVAINNNPKAPIFEYCDYGITGDMYKVIPELTSRLKRK